MPTFATLKLIYFVFPEASLSHQCPCSSLSLSPSLPSSSETENESGTLIYILSFCNGLLVCVLPWRVRETFPSQINWKIQELVLSCIAKHNHQQRHSIYLHHLLRTRVALTLTHTVCNHKIHTLGPLNHTHTDVRNTRKFRITNRHIGKEK